MSTTMPAGVGAEPHRDPAASGPAEIGDLLAQHHYLSDRGLATAIYLALALGQPLLLEGEAGVGKTEVAKALAECLDR
ncbi:MAG: AAA family ATPase, partial [Acidimicrobiales bacterium]